MLQEIQNPLFIIAMLVLLFCIVRGARKGMLRIIYGMISWVLLLVFVNIACGYIADYLNVNTPLPTMVQERIVSSLHNEYEEKEQAQEGEGTNAVLKLLPASIRTSVSETINESVDTLIQNVSIKLSESAIKGIATIMSVLLGIVLLFLLDKLIKLISDLPGVHGVNMVLGILTGCLEGMLIIWFAMYLADCFPTSMYGQFFIANVSENTILNYVYQANIIERVIGT